MKLKTYCIGITFYITSEMNEKINKEADVMRISKSDYIRKSIEFYQNEKLKVNSSKEQNDHE